MTLSTPQQTTLQIGSPAPAPTRRHIRLKLAAEAVVAGYIRDLSASSQVAVGSPAVVYAAGAPRREHPRADRVRIARACSARQALGVPRR